MRSASTTRAGMTLIEVLVALAILASGVSVWTALSSAGLGAMQSGADREREVAGASNVLNRVAMWDTATLNRRLGMSRANDYRIDLRLVAPGLYTVVVADDAGRHLLATSIYRRPPRAKHED